MSYSKTTWIKGDKITSDRLNKLEDGLEAAAAAADKAQLEILPEQTFAGWTPNDTGTLSTLIIEDAGGVTPIVGETYAVLFDGAEYICKCYADLTVGGLQLNNTRILGNGGVGGQEASTVTDDPFLIMGGYGKYIVWTSKTGDSHTLGIKLARAVNVEQIKASAEDEGKILSVVDGKPVWVAVAQAEDSSF